MGELLTKTCFSPQREPHSETMLFCRLKYFGGNSQTTSLFIPKSEYLRKEDCNTEKFVFHV